MNGVDILVRWAGRFLAVRPGLLAEGRSVTVDGIAILPVALFLWEDRATVHFAATDSATTDHGEAVERWARSARLDDSPVYPFTDSFSQLEIDLILTDGVEATAVGTSAGGSDSEWEVAARFRLPEGGAEGAIVVRMGRRGAAPVEVVF